MYKESQFRSIVKTLSYRVFGSVVIALVVYILTGKADIAFYVGGAEFFIKLFLFWFHERVWNQIPLGKQQIKPVVIWLTGLSGAGKTTIAKELCERMKKKNLNIEHLDGDSIRNLFPKTGFSKEERDRHIRRVGYLASCLSRNGVFVVASLISPYQESRDFVRSLCPNFMEVYVSTSLDICEKRDVKGLYAKVRKGEIKQFTGIDDVYEPPSNPELIVDTENITVQEAVNIIFKKLSL